MKIRHLYSFFADIYAFSVLALCFLSEITLFAIFDNVACLVSLTTNYKQQNTIRLQQPNNNSPFSRNLIQNNHILFRFQQTLNNKPPFAYAKKQNSPTLFRMKLTIKKYSPQAAIKQVNLYEPCIYDKQLGFNKPAVVIADCFLSISGISLLQWFFVKYMRRIVCDCF